MSALLTFGDTTWQNGSIFEDTGCDAGPSCLACPLPQCRYDDPHWRMHLRQVERQRRDREIVAALQQDGATVEQVAAQAGVVVRTVFRAQARMYREAAR